ncbi:hypothetical protein NQ315_004036 [Exocentrus adspersus]|uniref:Uncharacterized protein n=1 Tax=Exocentrus adspersus TaxID=1586481 RepID=A0AAV8W6J8_9CUCU|nr:hypothetical protein NQ315_004036 [Exocentrus adspersus]
MKRFKHIFHKKCSVIAMVHLDALPGSPLFAGSVENIVSNACKETETYLNNGIDGILVENMHDVPYVQSQHLGPEVTATMCRVCAELRKIIPREKPFGIQVLAGGNREALSVAKACSMNFIRAEGFVFSHIADEGFTDANAGIILRYRRNIQADDVLVFTDIKKKHSSHSITSDWKLPRQLIFFLSDGVILTGATTGDPANATELKLLKDSVQLPVLIGSGVTLANLKDYIHADALIVGSYFKKEGKWNQQLDEKRISDFMKKIDRYDLK